MYYSQILSSIDSFQTLHHLHYLLHKTVTILLHTFMLRYLVGSLLNGNILLSKRKANLIVCLLLKQSPSFRQAVYPSYRKLLDVKDCLTRSPFHRSFPPQCYSPFYPLFAMAYDLCPIEKAVWSFFKIRLERFNRSPFLIIPT